jgi:hypothetical protein
MLGRHGLESRGDLAKQSDLFLDDGVWHGEGKGV